MPKKRNLITVYKILKRRPDGRLSSDVSSWWSGADLSYLDKIYSEGRWIHAKTPRFVVLDEDEAVHKVNVENNEEAWEVVTPKVYNVSVPVLTRVEVRTAVGRGIPIDHKLFRMWACQHVVLDLKLVRRVK